MAFPTRAALAVLALALTASAHAETRDERLLSAARSGDLSKTAALLDQGACIEAKDEHGMTPLIDAAYRNHPEAVKVLLERGADVNARDAGGFTALSRAAQAPGTLIPEIP